MRNRRLELHLFQKDVAKSFGVSEETITNWESGGSKPQIQFYPRIIEFLNYSPWELKTDTVGDRIKTFRINHGMSHKKVAKLISVDSSTICSWEQGKSNPHINILEKLESLIQTTDG